MSRRSLILTNAAWVLRCVDRDPRARIEDMAKEVGVSERTVQRLIDELERAGVLSRTREGNHYLYAVHLDAPLASPTTSATVADFLSLLDS